MRFAIWPAVMVSSLAVTQWGFAAGVQPAAWVAGISAATFIVVVGLEHVLPAVPGSSLFRDRQSFNDVGHGLLIGVVSRPIALPITVGLAGLIVSTGEQSGTGIWPGSWPMAAQVALGLLLWSFPGYWTHRGLHRVGRLWWFHALHHDPTRMQVLKGNRIHLGEDLIANIIILFPLLALGAPTHVLLWIAMWNNSEGALAHSNIDMMFPAFAHLILPTPANHRVHHAADHRLQNSNFAGITPIWDHVFGTFRHPHANPIDEFGLGDGATLPSGFAAQLLLPFHSHPMNVGQVR